MKRLFRFGIVVLFLLVFSNTGFAGDVDMECDQPEPPKTSKKNVLINKTAVNTILKTGDVKVKTGDVTNTNTNTATGGNATATGGNASATGGSGGAGGSVVFNEAEQAKNFLDGYSNVKQSEPAQYQDLDEDYSSPIGFMFKVVSRAMANFNALKKNFWGLFKPAKILGVNVPKYNTYGIKPISMHPDFNKKRTKTDKINVYRLGDKQFSGETIEEYRDDMFKKGYVPILAAKAYAEPHKDADGLESNAFLYLMDEGYEHCLIWKDGVKKVAQSDSTSNNISADIARTAGSRSRRGDAGYGQGANIQRNSLEHWVHVIAFVKIKKVNGKKEEATVKEDSKKTAASAKTGIPAEKIYLGENVKHKFGKAEAINPEVVVDWAKNLPKYIGYVEKNDLNIIIESECDPIGSDAFNDNLGMKRTIVTAKLLKTASNNAGIDWKRIESRLTFVSGGEQRARKSNIKESADDKTRQKYRVSKIYFGQLVTGKKQEDKDEE